MNQKRLVTYWLISITLIILLMVVIGGITRLTDSGLSITDWKPIMGVIPPLHSQDWDHVFGLYKATPQYLQIHSEMTLSEFKFIYFWEYFHRLVGRSIGIFVLIPLFFFWRKKQINRSLIKKVLIGFMFGGLQGLLGWFMVKSGLVDRPSVSHYRLAAHLLLAFFLLIYFTWVICDYTWGSPLPKEKRNYPKLTLYFKFLKFFLVLQIIYGAFIAGLKAGWTYNTYPLMGGEWFPSSFWAMTPTLLNFFENAASVQWIHRWMGALILIGITVFHGWVISHPKEKLIRTRRFSLGLTLGIYLQFLLGILTLLYRVPIVLGVLHQFGAALIIILFSVISSLLKREA